MTKRYDIACIIIAARHDDKLDDLGKGFNQRLDLYYNRIIDVLFSDTSQLTEVLKEVSKPSDGGNIVRWDEFANRLYRRFKLI